MTVWFDLYSKPYGICMLLDNIEIDEFEYLEPKNVFPFRREMTCIYLFTAKISIDCYFNVIPCRFHSFYDWIIYMTAQDNEIKPEIDYQNARFMSSKDYHFSI